MISYRTSEFVSPGHPDKVMDTIAEAIVDYQVDNKGKKTAVDGLVKNNQVFLAGEVICDKEIPYEDIVKECLQKIGYTKEVSPDFNDANVKVTSIFTTQSPDIAMGVDKKEIGAGDIGIMFGAAIREAPDYTAWTHYLSRYLSYCLYKQLDWAKPDQKVQVTVKYEDDEPVEISTIICCVSHPEEMDLAVVVKEVKDKVFECLKSNSYIKLAWNNVDIKVNPTGKFSVYGPVADSGLVGRKIVCDQGSASFFSVGGGNLNGKDATKVDRSAVYMARYVAKNVVAKGYSDRCQIHVAYAIGIASPVSLYVETYGTNKVNLETIQKFVESFDFTPKAIIKRFGLTSVKRTFSYTELGMYGHIGARFADPQLPWEEIS